MEDWNFPTLAYIWDPRTGAIMAGADKLDAVPDDNRQRSLAALADHVRRHIAGLDDGWLVSTSFFMVDDIYKSFYRDFAWTPGAEDYLAATAGIVIEELGRRGMSLHYVVDRTDVPANLELMLTYLPAIFAAAGLSVIGPQIVARELMRRREKQPPTDLTAIQRYRDEGHEIADEVVVDWYLDGESTVYLNLDFADGAPGLSLDVAMSPCGRPRRIVVFRNQPVTEGSVAELIPPPDVALPPGILSMLKAAAASNHPPHPHTH